MYLRTQMLITFPSHFIRSDLKCVKQLIPSSSLCAACRPPSVALPRHIQLLPANRPVDFRRDSIVTDCDSDKQKEMLSYTLMLMACHCVAVRSLQEVAAFE